MEENITLAIGRVRINRCTRPYRRVIVDVEDEHTMAGQTGIPTCCLAILHKVILVLIAVVADKIGYIIVCQSRYVDDGCGFLQFYRCEPSHQPALVTRIACGLVTIAIVVAGVHQIPRVNE